MRQVRKKTVDPVARPYLLKAKKEGLELAWNKYESMLPQDGFSLLGLTCSECLQGPCRINPFREEERSTICGLSKADLVFNGLLRLAKDKEDLIVTAMDLINEIKHYDENNKLDEQKLDALSTKWELTAAKPSLTLTTKLAELSFAAYAEQAAGSEYSPLLAQGKQRAQLLDYIDDLQALLFDKKGARKLQTGLGLLKSKAVNLCFEGVSPVVLSQALEIAEELKEEAVKRGANEGFNILLIGDLSPYHAVNAATNAGAAEFALLTGLVDAYVTGRGVAGTGKNVAQAYQTVLAEGAAPGKAGLTQLFLQAAAAFTQRDEAKIVPSDQVETLSTGYELNADNIAAYLKQGALQGVCVIGGGSNVKVTEDALSVQIAEFLSGKDILSLTYSNASLTLGKYGYLTEGKTSASTVVETIMGSQNGPAVYSVGGELQAGSLVELVRKVQGQRVVAVFPEMSSKGDFQVALAMAEAGAKVLSAVKLPIDGSPDAEKFTDLIQYCDPQEFVSVIEEWLGN